MAGEPDDTAVRDDYAFWREALAGLTGAVLEVLPQPGFYRLKRGAGWQPIAIWRDGPVIVSMIAEREIDPAQVWPACARHPVDEIAYNHAIETGLWPGALSAAPAIGDNMPPADPAEALRSSIAEAVAQAQAWLKGRQIVSQADADRIEAYVANISAAQKDAEAQHKVEKAPHLEAGRKVDAAWRPAIEAATNAIRMLKSALTPFLNARAAEKKAQASKAIAGGAEPVRSDLRATTSGSHGRKVSLRTVRRGVIKNYPEALQFFAEHPEVRALVQKLADKVAAVGGTVPGVETVTEQVAA